MFPSLTSLKNSPFLRSASKVKSGEFQLYLTNSKQSINYQLVVSARRKSISLELKRSLIKVRCPIWLSHNDVEQFILAKQNWLMAKLEQQKTLTPFKNKLLTGALLLLDGHQYQLNITREKQFSLAVDDVARTLTLAVPNRVLNTEPYIRTKLTKFYYQQAQDYIPQRAQELEIQTNSKAKDIELKVYKRRWGCCYSSGLVRINPMLMGAPKWFIYCVIIHELSHLTHMNHSAEFWQLNKKHCSHCKDSKKWLRENGQLLQLN